MAIRKKSTFAKQSLELAIAAPQVMGLRMLQISLAGLPPSQRDSQEFYRMWTEKVAAFGESWNAMAMEMFFYQQSLWLAYASYWINPWSRSAQTSFSRAHTAGQKLLSKGLAPIHRRAVSNARRLSRSNH